MHHSSVPWQITVDTSDRAKRSNFRFSNCQSLLWNHNVSPALHLQVLSCLTLHYIALSSQPCPTWPCRVILTLLLVLTWSINWRIIQQKCRNFLNFIAFVGRYLLAPSATLSFTPSFFWKWNVLWWYICHVSFTYIWLVVPKFSICKCFGNCRKDRFRLLLGGFLAVIS